MLRKNFPGRKAIRQAAAQSRHDNPLTDAERRAIYHDNAERSMEFDKWQHALLMSTRYLRKQHTPSQR